MKTTETPGAGTEAPVTFRSISELLALKRAAQEPVLRDAMKKAQALIMDLRK